MVRLKLYKLLIIMITLLQSVSGQHVSLIDKYPDSNIEIINRSYHFWENVMHQSPEWWQSPPAVSLAENVLHYQRECGGWPKNIDMLKPLTDSKKKDLAIYPNEPRATIDNDATWSQLFFLAKILEFHPEKRYELAFLRGLDYLLAAQYDNGGWPQYYPPRKGYYTHITYNDKAMIGVLELLKDISDNPEKYTFLDNVRRQKVNGALDKGIDCILATQIEVDGILTAWCAQHDEKTLEPIGARKYELPSITSKESVEILVFLMSISDPTQEIIKSVQSAVKWLESVKLKNIKLVTIKDKNSPTGYDRKLIKKMGAKPLWARFYDMETFKPFFSDRDGKVYKNYDNISWERRNDYGWIGDWPRESMYSKYKMWQQKYASGKYMLEK